MRSRDLIAALVLNFRRITREVAQISRSPYGAREQMKLVWWSLWRHIHEWVVILLGRKAEGYKTRILGYEIFYRDRLSFSICMSEVFFRQSYNFHAATASPAILDCGANIGIATLFFKHLYPHAKITAFEAAPSTCAILNRNVSANLLSDVSVHNLILSNADGHCPFYIMDDSPGSLIMSVVPGRVPDGKEIIMRSCRLSDYIHGRVDLLKLDVEGSESAVLEDLKASDKLREVQKMIIEYHHKIGNSRSCLAKFLALLEGAGFEYQISAACDPISQEQVTQDILIGAYRIASVST